MSMLSAQCDELRAWAQMMDSMSAGPELGKALRDAADMIWDLRNECVRQNTENDKLNRDIEKCSDRCSELGFYNFELEKQLDELRELCVVMCEDMRISCQLGIPITSDTMAYIRNRMAECEIEVDE